MSMTVIILAGGLATRLRPLTKKIPKALINVGGKPFIFWQLELLKRQGIKDIVICCGYLGEMIESTVGDGKKLGLNVIYSFDGSNLLGTGGAIKNSLHLLPEYFIVMYGDTILSIDFKKLQNTFNLSKIKNLMTILKNNNKWAPSNINFKNKNIIQYSNNNNSDTKYIDYGLSILSKKYFEQTKKQKFNLDIIFKKLINEKQLLAFEVKKRFYEINTADGLLETEEYLTKNLDFL